jgi:hypothetical protein
MPLGKQNKQTGNLVNRKNSKKTEQKTKNDRNMLVAER